MRTKKIHLSMVLRAVLIGTGFACMVPVLITDHAENGSISPGSLIGVVVLAAVVIPVSFASHWAEFTDDDIRLRWAPIHTSRIPRESVTTWSVTDEAVSPWRYGGIGLRLASRGTLAFVNRKGRVLELETSRNRRYAITLADDEEVAAVHRELSSRDRA